MNRKDLLELAYCCPKCFAVGGTTVETSMFPLGLSSAIYVDFKKCN